jgi:hypothetical protein
MRIWRLLRRRRPAARPAPDHEARDEGSAMIVAIMMGAVFTALAAGLMANALAESGRSGRAVQGTTSLAAAEAGADDYIAKLTQDQTYFLHTVHPGESTRKDATSTKTATAGQAWTGGVSWTYPSGRDAWRTLDNGYQYNLQITPPAPGSGTVRIVSTGRKTGATTGLRTIEVLVRPASIADFQMVSNADISYGSTATTSGKIYAGIDGSNVKHSISHSGTASGDLYAEGSITGSPTYTKGARGYNSSTIRSVIPTPLNFNTFTTSLVDLKAAAQAGGIYLDDSRKDGWRLTFNSGGTVTIASCMKYSTWWSSYQLAEREPTCTTTGTVPVPASGAIYANQTVIVMGQVKGRATVASNADIVIGGNVTYATRGVDVLGLVAKNDMIVAYWAPTNLTWYSATIAQTGQWRSWNSDGSKSTLNFYGSTATNKGGYMGMYDYRNYNYDENLLYLQPPFFPVIADNYTILLERELTP